MWKFGVDEAEVEDARVSVIQVALSYRRQGPTARLMVR
jgi:hypothetical protein